MIPNSFKFVGNFSASSGTERWSLSLDSEFAGLENRGAPKVNGQRRLFWKNKD